MLFGSTLPNPVTVKEIVLSAFFWACITADFDGCPRGVDFGPFSERDIRVGGVVGCSSGDCESPRRLNTPLIVEEDPAFFVLSFPVT